MKIERIELYNFGSYEDINSFELMSDDVSKRIVIVGGKNGAGKTTLFTAMQICLYGHASFGFKTSGKRYLKEIYDLVLRFHEEYPEECFATIFYMKYVQNKKQREIAACLNISQGEVSKRLFNLMQKIHEVMN